jgi:hypothetical protein
MPQMKRILGDTSNTNDTTYLLFIQQAVYEVDATLNGGRSVTVTGSSFALTPAPTATSTLWNVLANNAVLLYHREQLRAFRSDMEGLDSIRDEVTTFRRGTTMREMRADVEAQQKRYNKVLADYKRLSGDGGSAIDEIAMREDT